MILARIQIHMLLRFLESLQAKFDYFDKIIPRPIFSSRHWEYSLIDDCHNALMQSGLGAVQIVFRRRKAT